MGEPLRVLSVAYRLDDLVISLPAPARHHEIAIKLERLKPRVTESGFLLSDGEFATRARAYKVAEAAGQLLPRRPGGYNGPDLYSEDVW